MKTDTELQHDVANELSWEPSVHSSQIGVSVKDGVVTLSGEVSSFGEKWLAERAAQRVKGVFALVIELTVKISALGARTDADIARSAETALSWVTSLPPGACKVMVENGVITLFGKVESGYLKHAVYEAVRHLPGVSGLSNQIIIDAEHDAGADQADIYAAINRVADSSEQEVNVKVSGENVTLTGTVKGWWVRDLMNSAVWSAPGVKHVVDLTTFMPVVEA